MAKSFNLTSVIFILFRISISMVWATDCETFTNAVPYIFDDKYSFTNRFEERYKKELDCCFIEEINCDDQKNIIGIDLGKKYLSDVNAIFTKLGNLKNLIEITMEYTEFGEAEKPINVGNLGNLANFDIKCDLSNKINYMPEGLENLNKLEVLKISSCGIEGNLTDYITNSIGKMNSLKTLNLSDNQLAGPIPVELKNMKNLENLYLNSNNLDGYIPHDLVEMENLKQLFLNGNEQLDGYVPPFPNISDCNYENSGLCTLKGEKCRAPIQCYKAEIEDGNKHNGVSDPNAYVDKAITDEKDRNVEGGNKVKNFFSALFGGLFMLLGVAALAGLCYFCNRHPAAGATVGAVAALTAIAVNS